MDYSRINSALNNETPAQPTQPVEYEVTIVTLGGVQTLKATEGMSVAEFKNKYALNGTTLVDEEGNVLNNAAIFDEDTQIFVSTPKKNG